MGCLVGFFVGRFDGFFVGCLVAFLVGRLVEAHPSPLDPSVQQPEELQPEVDEDQPEPHDLPDLPDLPLPPVVVEPLDQPPRHELLHQPPLLHLDLPVLESLAYLTDLDLLLPKWYEGELEESRL